MRNWLFAIGLLLTIGCGKDSLEVIDKEVTLTDRVFQVQEYDHCPDIFRTSDIEYLCVGTWTTIHGGTIMDVRVGIKIRYSARSFSTLHTPDDFPIFTYYVDDLTILSR